MFHQVIFANVPEGNSSDTDITGKLPVLSGEDSRNGTLTTAGLSNQGNKTSSRNLKIDPAKDLTVLLIGKMHIPKRNIQTALRQSLLSGFRLRNIQYPENLITGSHTVHGNMKKGSKQPQRQKKLTGQKHNAEGSGKV